jgi:YD repeat-containing protein
VSGPPADNGGLNQVTSYRYGSDGQLSAMSDASGTSSYSYDPFGELTSVTNGAGKTLSYRYDALGRTTDVTYPLGSVSWAVTPALHESYDEDGHLASLTDFEGNTIAVSDTYDGIPDQTTLGPSGESVVTSYDSTDSPSSIDLNGTGGTLLGFSYSDTPAGLSACGSEALANQPACASIQRVIGSNGPSRRPERRAVRPPARATVRVHRQHQRVVPAPDRVATSAGDADLGGGGARRRCGRARSCALIVGSTASPLHHILALGAPAS